MGLFVFRLFKVGITAYRSAFPIPMNKTILFSAIILSIALVVSAYIEAPQRYLLVSSGSPERTETHEIDTQTGKIWSVYDSRKQVLNENVEKEKILPLPADLELPQEEVSKIELGTPSLIAGSEISGDCYNSGTWLVNRMIVTITLTKADGNVLWTRDYEIAGNGVVATPLRSRPISVSIASNPRFPIFHQSSNSPSDPMDGVKVTWKIKKAFGQKSQNP